jgi:molybdenum cofactor synthesis domain-containing protein
MEPVRTGAAAVITGSEVLTAKIQDQNGPLLIQRLRARGVPMRWMATVHDDLDAIVEAVTIALRRAKTVITSGGIGPTHDDVTVRAVATALGRGVERLPEMEALIREHYRDATTKEAMRLADVPEGSVLIPQEGTWYPVIQCDDVYLLPGVPQLFRLQLETVLARLPGKPVFAWALYLSRGETEIAAALDQVALELPDVAIGSYPQFDQGLDYRVKVTVEGEDERRVMLARDRLRRAFPNGAILREEGGL